MDENAAVYAKYPGYMNEGQVRQAFREWFKREPREVKFVYAEGMKYWAAGPVEAGKLSADGGDKKDEGL